MMCTLQLLRLPRVSILRLVIRIIVFPKMAQDSGVVDRQNPITEHNYSRVGACFRTLGFVYSM